MTLRNCYYLLFGILFKQVISRENTASTADIKFVPNGNHQQFEITETELLGLEPDGAITFSTSTFSSQDIRPTAFTNRIGGSKSIDVSWLFPDREDFEDGLLRINNNTEFEEVVERFKKYLKNSIDEITRSATPHLVKTFYGLEISPACMGSASDLLEGVRNLKEWALRMLDSIGFYPGSLMDGTFISIGNYDMCVNTEATSESAGELFVGQYCSVHIRPNLSSPTSSHRSPPWHVFIHRKEFEHIMELPTPKLQRFLDLAIYRAALCIPSTCSKQDVQTWFDAVSRYTRIFNITVQQCEMKQNQTEKLDAQLTAWICLLGTTVAFVLICTLVDIAHNHRKEGTSLFLCRKDESKNLKSILKLFSLLRNAQRLTSLESLDDKLDFVHGMRVFTTAWIVLGHCYAIDPRLFGGTAVVANFGPSVWFQLICNGYFSVDTFLFMSGFLVSYFCLHRMRQQNGRFNYIAFYASRILRITPPYFFVIGIYVLVSSLGSGPLWHDMMRTYFLDKCKQTWWKNMLYINNFFFHGNSVIMQRTFLVFRCSDATLLNYSSACRIDVQKMFFGLVNSIPFDSVCATLHGILTYFWNLPPSFLLRPISLDEFREYSAYTYFMPYHHGGPYFLGMALGYFLHVKGDIKLSPMVKWLGWIASTVICLSAIYGIYPWNRGDNFPQEWVAIYAAFSRTAWGLGIAWIFFACSTGNGGFVNSFLSSKPLIPISRLSYCVYLIHFIFITSLYAHSRSVQYLQHLFMVYLFAAVMFLGHLAAFFCTLFFESPFITLLSTLQSKNKSDIKRGQNPLK